MRTRDAIAPISDPAVASSARRELLTSVLIGTAVGDSIGLPAEGMSRHRIARRWRGEWRQRLVFGKGMISDDTEHTVFTLQALIAARGDVSIFRRVLAWKLRWWLACLPAGIGFATLRAIGKLWLGWSPEHSGVYSAGNGPAMRTAIIGAFHAGDEAAIGALVRASTRLTHTDPRAEVAALAVALTASALASRVLAGEPRASLRTELTEEAFAAFLELWRSTGPGDPEWLGLMGRLEVAWREGRTVAEFAENLGLAKGVTGYAYHTVPVALFASVRHTDDPRAALEAVLNCGGNTDSTGAITAALAALRGDLPAEWIHDMRDWPISIPYLKSLAEACVGNRPSRFAWWGLPLRNAFFLLVVLTHAVRRVVP